ncbi:heavy metal translocating P-type ATPase [Stakelama marina]|uniref:Cadmium-translocating P-type ATPase n=1 Tax=Stakelama marina TaxID=2826939 RepID=A0A8T4IDU0_9SPHN|nr:heavy metal translocating P-type ATPase [Stakelama marina]MBR0552024.1 cadmium-translocating P-type ATPase [Stakelama marina]
MNAVAPPAEGEALSTSLFAVEGLRCAGCIAKLEHGLGAVPGVAMARVNFTTRRVRVEHEPALDDDALTDAIAALGFDAHPYVEAVSGAVKRESRSLVLALAVAGFAAMNVMLLSVAIWSGADTATRAMFHWLSALIALPAIAYSGRPFFASAWRALRRGRTNMDVPISIGLVLTAGVSLYETATGGEHAYFDGAVMLLFFLLVGRFLDSVMRSRAEDGVTALIRRVPADALVLGKDGTAERRAADEIAPGMRVLVAAGERIGVDGEVIEGASSVDRSLVTGESDPVAIGEGDPVLAGTINLDQPITIRTTASGAATVVADIARLMENAGQSRSRYVRIADRAARLYAPVVHSLAALTFAGWFISGAGLHQSVLVAVSVLIITCPCAIGIAVPIAQVVVSGALMRAGILVKDGAALERLATIDTVLLDKTGTVTAREAPVLATLDAQARAILLALARASRHPLSRRVAETLSREGVIAAEGVCIREETGCGVAGSFDGVEARFGKARWAAGVPGGTVLATDGRSPVAIDMVETAHADSAAAVARLRSMGIDASIVSGDETVAVERLGDALGISARGRMQPTDKLAVIETLEGEGRRVLMVGDGLNDGPALGAATASMAPASATDVGKLTADLIFFGERLTSVPTAIAAARRTRRIVQQNFALAVGYNLLAVPLAVAGFVTPLIAALAMSGSSLLVVGNALRLNRIAR